MRRRIFNTNEETIMEFLSERILRLAGLEEGEEQKTLTEGLSEEAVETHQPFTTDATVESVFAAESDDETPDVNEISVDYAIKESNQALVESRLRDAIRAELKAILGEGDETDEDDVNYGAPGFKQYKPSKKGAHMGGIGVGFANWKQK